MHDLLLLQLGFNVLILSALLVLAVPKRSRKQVAARKAARAKAREARVAAKAEKAAQRKAAKARRTPAPREAVEPAPSSSLSGLIAREEAKELVAEEALRMRLDRFRSRAAS